MFFIDVDNFKLINDTQGHIFGDQVLKEVALRLSHSIRNSDTLARFGGDEFIILLENISDRNAASTMAKTLAQALKKDFVIEGETVEMSCSMGVAIFPDDGCTADTLITRADKVMYQNK